MTLGPWLEIVRRPGHYDAWEETGNDPGDAELESYEVQTIAGVTYQVWRRHFNAPSEAPKLWAQRIL